MSVMLGAVDRVAVAVYCGAVEAMDRVKVLPERLKRDESGIDGFLVLLIIVAIVVVAGIGLSAWASSMTSDFKKNACDNAQQIWGSTPHQSTC